ncbi:MAG TPA: efflux RND transporter periplasmic adaptor subunit [Opitutaceae bacterium]|jgi:RND family efflux transporter MFP subunit|nr:efflux RND transporter periplasmic adaptor subunit [Opitutaceae bacterium]
MSAAPAKPAPSNSGRKLLAVLAAVVVLAVLYFYLSRPTARVVAVRRGNADDARPGSVTVVAQYEEPITIEVGGRLIDSNLEPGNHYAKGQYMAQLDTGDIDLTIQKAENDLSTLVATHDVGSRTALNRDTAQAQLENDERIYKMGGISLAAIEAERRQIQALNQDVKLEGVNFGTAEKADELAIKTLQRQKSKMTVTAPFDGVVSVVTARPGAILAGGAPLATLITTARTVVVRVAAEKFAGIAVGQPASVEFLGYNGKFFDAKVTQVLPTADADTQRYVVYVTIDPKQITLDQLVPGMPGEASIQVDRHANSLLAPRRALQAGKVLVVDGGRVEVRDVKVGFTSLTDVEILDGLKEGDQVIAEDLDTFHPGDRVRAETLAN